MPVARSGRATPKRRVPLVHHWNSFRYAKTGFRLEEKIGVVNAHVNSLLQA